MELEKIVKSVFRYFVSTYSGASILDTLETGSVPNREVPSFQGSKYIPS